MQCVTNQNQEISKNEISPIKQQPQAPSLQNPNNQNQEITSNQDTISKIEITPIKQQHQAPTLQNTIVSTPQQIKSNPIQNNIRPSLQAFPSENKIQTQTIKPTFTTINDVFNMLDKNKTGKISISDFRRVIGTVNKNLNRNYGDDDLQMFFNTLNKRTNDQITFNEFLRSFEFLDAFEQMQKK